MGGNERKNAPFKKIKNSKKIRKHQKQGDLEVAPQTKKLNPEKPDLARGDGAFGIAGIGVTGRCALIILGPFGDSTPAKLPDLSSI